MFPIVYLAPIAWTSLCQRPQQLALRLAARATVNYVDPVGLRSMRPGDVLRVRERHGASTHASIAVVRPRYIPLMGMGPIDAINRRWLMHQLRRFLPKDDGDWILWTGSPNLLAEALVAQADPALVVYDCMDRYAAFHGGRHRLRIERAEQRIVGRADLVLASSVALQARLARYHGNVQLAPNGVDCEAFAVRETLSPAPEALRGVRRPVIGFQGTIGPWVDFGLIERLARCRPEWSFVFLGPVRAAGAARLRGLPNVRIEPPVPYRDLPRWTAAFDVGIVPFVLNELTRSVNPIKALEYLAAGRATVSTPLADLEPLADFVSFARTDDEWITAIEAGLHPSAQTSEQVEARRRAVSGRSWDRIAEEIAVSIESLEKTHGSHSAPRCRTPRDRAA